MRGKSSAGVLAKIVCAACVSHERRFAVNPQICATTVHIERGVARFIGYDRMAVHIPLKRLSSAKKTRTPTARHTNNLTRATLETKYAVGSRKNKKKKPFTCVRASLPRLWMISRGEFPDDGFRNRFVSNQRALRHRVRSGEDIRHIYKRTNLTRVTQYTIVVSATQSFTDSALSIVQQFTREISATS